MAVAMTNITTDRIDADHVSEGRKGQQLENGLPFVWSEIPVSTPKDVAIARQLAGIAAGQLFASPARRQETILIASELAQNHLAHATQNGMIRMSGMCLNGIPVITIASLDEGPGIPNVEKALEDGFSTSGGLGIGLGTVKRLSNRLHICSMQFGPSPCPRPPVYKNYTTIVSATIEEQPSDIFNKPKGPSLHVSGLVRPCPGQTQSGDTICLQDDGSFCRMALIDATGHGETAAIIARDAARLLEDLPLSHEPDQVIEALNAALSGSNGASVQVLSIDYRLKKILAVGVGNAACTIYSAGKGHIVVPRPGLVGNMHTPPGQHPIQMASINDIAEDLLIVMHSDGVLHPPDLTDYLSNRASAAIWSQILFQPKNTPMDDSSLAVLRWL